ncbi:carboxylesterase 5A-like [Uloborus diversus]|uniref:carboxylesterase 5A-like n=1 Tax=Uloborus diversus TaxID=327109 RepID=UPI00240A565F|nr:carboxylesterase 5A-like [Uloborus diversus]
MNLPVIICLVVACSTAATDDLRISTTSGTVNGKLGITLGQKVKMFLGVPYAQAPLASLRFRPPVALRQTTELNATYFRPSCLQPPHLPSVVSPLLHLNRAEFNEDCLFLNIYVPSVSQTLSKFPVIVFLAGEGFNYADPSQFDGSYLAANGLVIFVTVNYRVSVFGFLSALTDSAPGNVGLYDQRLALNWINENIENFGGDKDRITLFGRFTGAMSAAIHAFSPLSRNEKLFQQIILQSGVPVGDWVFDRNPLNATLSLAAKMQCLSMNLSDTINCLREIPAQELLEASMEVKQSWRPVFDFKLINTEPIKAAATSSYNPVDILLGMNNNEGTLCTIGLQAAQSPLFNKIVNNTINETDFQDLLTDSMDFMYKKTDQLLNKLAINKYKYLSHRASFSIHPAFIEAGHGDDVLFSFGLPLQMKNLTEHEKTLTYKMLSSITNFARFGHPDGYYLGPDPWLPYTKEARYIMDFRADERAVIKSPNQDAMDFFHDIIPAVADSECFPSPLPIVQASSQRLIVDSHGQEKPITPGVMLGLLCGFLMQITAAINLLFHQTLNHRPNSHLWLLLWRLLPTHRTQGKLKGSHREDRPDLAKHPPD